MKEIKLTHGKVALIDDEDYDRLSKTTWYAYRNGKKYGKWYAATGASPRITMHSVLLKVANGNHVDHADNDSLNNQKYNLREATYSQNSANRKAQAIKSSPYLGVFKVDNMFQAASRKDGKLHRSKRFISENEAALAYNKLAVKNHGEFANLNILKIPCFA